MLALVALTALAVVVTKALDCLSTLTHVRHAGAELNPLARALMGRFGFRRTVAAVFVVSVLWTVLIAWIVLAVGWWPLAVGFAATGAFVALVQGATAWTNWTGRWNAVTRGVVRFGAWARSRGRARPRRPTDGRPGT